MRGDSSLKGYFEDKREEITLLDQRETVSLWKSAQDFAGNEESSGYSYRLEATLLLYFRR